VPRCVSPKCSQDDLFGRYCALLRDLEEAPRLKFGFRAVPVSRIGAQYYCEKQVELTAKHEEVGNTEAQLVGMEMHESLVESADRVSVAEIWQEATRPDRREPCRVREFHVVARFGEIPMEGFVDEVWFFGGSAFKVREYKLGKSPHIERFDWV